jgi:DALR anticodon binding domain
MVFKVAQNHLNSRLLSVALQNPTVSAIRQQLLTATQQLSDLKLDLSMVPLHRLPGNLSIIYRSAIAFKLAPVLQLPSLNLAHQIIAAFEFKGDQMGSQQLDQDTQTQPPLLMTSESQPEFQLNFLVEVIAPGWIEFRLTSCSLADWLQKLTALPSTSLQTQPEALNCFSVQYAHARCCSILNLAAIQGLIILKDWQMIEPNPIPWLDDQPEAVTGHLKLRLEHPAEKSLIARFWDILEAKDHWDKQRKLKAAIALSQDFETFYQHCRIWGEVKTDTPKLAQARLGLIAVNQQLLRSLQDDLGIPAPIEL